MVNASIQLESSVAIVILSKDLTVFNNDELSDRIHRLADQGVMGFIFNLTETGWIDSMGINCILTAGKISLQQGKKAQVVGANKKVSDAIAQVKLDMWINMAPSMSAARAHYGLSDGQGPTHG